MSNVIPLQPLGTVSISASTASSSVALSVSGTNSQVLVTNSGTTTAFFEFGTSGVTASTSTSCPVLAGTQQVFTKPLTATHAAAIMASSTATIYFTSGAGV